MKTQDQITTDIARLQAWQYLSIKDRKKSPPPVVGVRSKELHCFLTKCLHYVQTNPDIKIVETQLVMVEKEIAIIKSRYRFFDPKEIKFKNERAKRAYFFNKLHEMQKLKAQQKAMRYLLDKEDPDKNKSASGAAK